jgi:hypothetical protein
VTIVASGRGCVPDELSPCTARPSSHSVASLRVSRSRSTRAPVHGSGTVAVTRSQCVANSGPSSAPSSTVRYSRPCADSWSMRPTGGLRSSRSTVATSGCTSAAIRASVWRRRSRV